MVEETKEKQPASWKDILQNDEFFKLHLKKVEEDKLNETEKHETVYSFEPFLEFFQCKKCEKLLPRTKFENHLQNKEKCHAISENLRKWRREKIQEKEDLSSTCRHYFAVFTSMNDSGIIKRKEQCKEFINKRSMETHTAMAESRDQRLFKNRLTIQRPFPLKNLDSSHPPNSNGLEENLSSSSENVGISGESDADPFCESATSIFSNGRTPPLDTTPNYEKHMPNAEKSSQRPYKIMKDLISPPTRDEFEVILPNNLVPPASNLGESSMDTISLETAQVELPGTSQESTSSPLRQRAPQAGKRGLKRKTNALLKVTEGLDEYVKERHLASQKESDQHMKTKESEFHMKKEEHKLKMQVLQAKLNYYNALTKGLSTKDK